jgi:hypothetical protein
LHLFFKILKICYGCATFNPRFCCMFIGIMRVSSRFTRTAHELDGAFTLYFTTAVPQRILGITLLITIVISILEYVIPSEARNDSEEVLWHLGNKYRTDCWPFFSIRLGFLSVLLQALLLRTTIRF